MRRQSGFIVQRGVIIDSVISSQSQVRTEAELRGGISPSTEAGAYPPSQDRGER